TRGLVKLNTNPSGSTIKLNGKQIKQKTPYQLDSVKIGPITVEYEKEGYHKWSSKFLVEGGVVTFVGERLMK
ncbi:MAG: PEGA domain-containing protein, partial [Flavobacteriia bacterium]|nr:PEGA domain-containing protein [Flavobacteriia bacterium]